MTTSLAAPAPPARRPPATSLRAAWIPLFALALAFFVEMVDNTVLTIALPTIGRDLGAGTTDLQWVTGAYSLTFGGLLLTAGSLADRLGRRRVLLWGLTAFGAVSAFVTLVTTSGQLIGLRAALGAAAAAMAPVTASLVFRLFEDEMLRMRAMTIMLVVGMSGFALGPIAAGSVLAHFPWQWLLLVNVPIAVIAWIGVRLGVPADGPEDLHPAPLDVPGAILSTATLGLASYILTSGVEFGWTSWITLVVGALALACGAGFVARERSAAHPMLDLRVFSGRTVRGASLAQLGGASRWSGRSSP